MRLPFKNFGILSLGSTIWRWKKGVKCGCRKLSTELDHRQQERWKREWQISKMRHRGIPQMIRMTTYEFEGRYPILIHEYAKGEQLRRRHDNRPLSQTQSMLICEIHSSISSSDCKSGGYPPKYLPTAFTCCRIRTGFNLGTLSSQRFTSRYSDTEYW